MEFLLTIKHDNQVMRLPVDEARRVHAELALGLRFIDNAPIDLGPVESESAPCKPYVIRQKADQAARYHGRCDTCDWTGHKYLFVSNASQEIEDHLTKVGNANTKA